ncbi:isochorismate synthase [Nonlabens marinus S1-08]|uniref:isochorismate synthase n=2 Tax=Nonlabens TaxID=363408 RepID=W8VXX6_9FLAO|nr:isochorismate synthase [Nonlabens marinus S1-08]
MAYAIFSKFQKSEDQIFVYAEVIQEFEWSVEVTKASHQSISSNSEARKDHEKLVSDAVQTIRNTELQKVVLSRKESVVRNHSDIQILENLLDSYPIANCYFFYHPAVGKWMGATPETLLSYKNGVLQTMSLAGTQKLQNGVKVTWGKKEKQEQNLVTDFIISALQIAGVEKIKSGETETVQAGNLLHLRTQIQATTTFYNLQNCINELHPTPAVCGLPRSIALKYILDHENYDRSFYTGYLGWNDPQSQTADYYVNLRCMELQEDAIQLYAGGGITAMSDPTAEFEEVQNKLLTMASIV